MSLTVHNGSACVHGTALHVYTSKNGSACVHRTALHVYTEWLCMCIQNGSACVHGMALHVYTERLCMCAQNGSACVHRTAQHVCTKRLCMYNILHTAKFTCIKFKVYDLKCASVRALPCRRCALMVQGVRALRFILRALEHAKPCKSPCTECLSVFRYLSVLSNLCLF